MLADDLGREGDEAIGVRLVVGALTKPVHWIAQNAGVSGPVTAIKVGEQEAGVGYDARSGEYVDMVSAGIIDPVKVTRAALENAASIAGMLLTTEVIIADKPATAESADAGHGHGHGH